MKKFLPVLALVVLALPLALFAGENTNTISILVQPMKELVENEKTEVKIELSEIAGNKPVTSNDLKIAHTKKLHLLIIDPTLTDYHHVHPVETEHPGEFVFDFIPKKAGMYRVWADVTPLKTGKQEYVMGDFGRETGLIPDVDKTINTETTVDGYKFKILFDSDLKTGTASEGTVKVEDKDGRPVTNLEPVMGAYAHIVGFNENFKSVVHIHPMGAEPQRDTDRGGPELNFHMQPEDSGFVKLFVQVKIDGKEIFAPFGLMVSSNAFAMNDR